MGRMVIVGYKPKVGKNEALKRLMHEHWAILKSQELVTDRASIMMEAADGTIVEVFEWLSEEAMSSAHTNPAVQKMWADYAEACDYVPIGELPESQQIFSEFTPLNFE